jgi:hypothetical protein
MAGGLWVMLLGRLGGWRSSLWRSLGAALDDFVKLAAVQPYAAALGAVINL